jgi:hypothetical protein
MRRLRSTVSRLGPRDGSLQLGLLIGVTLSAAATATGLIELNDLSAFQIMGNGILFRAPTA